MLLENQTPRGKQNPLPAALKQRHAKTCFQIPHLLRDARLRNSEPVGCAAKASRFGNCEKIAKVTNIQRLRHGKRQYCSAGSANAMRSLTAKAPAVAGERLQNSGLIAGQDSASIGKTYWAISKTNTNDFEAHHRRFADCSAGGGL